MSVTDLALDDDDDDDERKFCKPYASLFVTFLQTFPLSKEDTQLLLFYRTQAIVSGAWTDVKVK